MALQNRALQDRARPSLMSADQSNANGDVPPAADDPLEPLTLETIRRALRGLRYGQVVVIVQDGVVVQVDRTERRRLRLNRHSK